jgi:hypothetical protein|nr:hypothetical protein [Kofleriaceae bacterium]
MTRFLALAAALAVACGGSSNNNPKVDSGSGGSGMDAALPPDAMLTTITGSAVFDIINGSGSQTLGLNAAAINITSASLNGSDFVTEIGTYNGTDGSFTVPVVQGDADWGVSIEFGSAADGAVPIWVIGNDTSPDFSETFWEEATAVFPTKTTNTTLAATGLTPWGAIDDFEIMDPTNGACFFSPYAIGNFKPALNAVAMNGTFNWALQTDGQLLGSGEPTFAWQLTTQGSAGNQFAAIAQIGSAVAPVQTDGNGGALTFALTKLTPNETLQVAFDHDGFEGLKSQVGTGATDDPEQFFLVDALPFASQHGDYASAPDLVEWGVDSPIPAGSAVAQTFNYANPFELSAGVPLEEFVIIRYLFDIKPKAPKAGSPSSTPVTVGIEQDIPLSMLSRTAVNSFTPAVTPVTDVQVNGQAIDGATATGTTPTLSWTAPATGTITGYTIVIEQVANHTNATQVTEVGVVNTKATSVQIPPGMIVPGENVGYQFIITAFAEPGFDPSHSPFQQKLPNPSASMLSGQFQP